MPYKQCITDGSTIRVTASYPYYDDGTRHSGIDTVHTDLKAFAQYAGGEPPIPPEPPGPEPGHETEKRKMPIWMMCAPVWRYKR